MCNKRARRPTRGFTLVEMVIAIVVISVGLTGVLLAFNTTVKSSADPLIQKQMLAIAEEMMDEILLKPFSPPGSGFDQSNSVWPVKCATKAAVRSSFDDVADYINYATTGVCNVDGEAVDGLAAYNVSVGVTSEAWQGTDATLHVTVTVAHGGETLALDGWRTNYAAGTP